MSWWYAREYVSVEQKRRKAEALIEKLKRKRKDLKPVRIEGRTLARTFWGKAWCTHMDRMADYANRLPRGRSYVRNNAVCHLEIRRGEIEALVSGTSLYTVRMQVNALDREQWSAITRACAGKIGTLVDLLQGKLSKEVMAVVCHPKTGLFPQPAEISFTCSCPDYAGLCKHVAAVFYGVGNRLDTMPELLFLLRHVDPGELFSMAMPVQAAEQETAGLAGVDLEDLFGITLERAEERKKDALPPSAPPDFSTLTGADIAALRETTGLSRALFASRLGVTEATIWNWERTQGVLVLRARSRKNLSAFYENADAPGRGLKPRRRKS
jgi:uncharacterized Zn finger protein